MQANELKEKLAGPTHELLAGDEAGVDLAREVGHSVGGLLFAGDDPARVIDSLINMEAYFHHLRDAALAALQDQLATHYQALAAVITDEHGHAVELKGGERLPLPGHTAPALNELVARLEPSAGGDNPRLCLELIQQTIRLMEVLGMNRLELLKQAA